VSKIGKKKQQLILNLNILGVDLVWINIWFGLVTADFKPKYTWFRFSLDKYLGWISYS